MTYGMDRLTAPDLTQGEFLAARVRLYASAWPDSLAHVLAEGVEIWNDADRRRAALAVMLKERGK